MRVFVYEYCCARAGDGPLRAEGWAMLSAGLADLARCPGVRPVTLVAPDLAPAVTALSERLTAYPAAGGEEQLFRQLAGEADYSLVIAPEFDGLLSERCRWVEEANGRLLGPSAEGVRRTADKLGLARHWQECGVPTPPAIPLETSSPAPFPFPLVCKPRDGAGSLATFLVKGGQELAACPARARAEGWHGELILQPYAPGLPASVAFLAGPGRLLALPGARQRLSVGGRLRYRGGALPLAPELDRRARRLAERAAGSVPGLRGYFGLDLVLGEAADGSADVAIEINPRLTTSYVGLRELARFNLMGALLAVVAGGDPPAWDWAGGPVDFSAGEGAG
jgi:predicted ATP-grasp superfamily ATP-dependent carboligase